VSIYALIGAATPLIDVRIKHAPFSDVIGNIDAW
jgi:hypothetical protein